MENIIYDTIIFGCSAAGMSATNELINNKKKILIIDPLGFGGRLNKTQVINSSLFESGKDICSKYLSIANDNLIIKHKASFINYDHGMFKVYLDDNTLVCSRTILVATGVEYEPFNWKIDEIYYYLPENLNELAHKNIIITEVNNLTASYALKLAEHCRKVYLCSKDYALNCSVSLEEKLNNNSKIEIFKNSSIVDYERVDNKLKNITLSTYNKVNVSAIFAVKKVVPQTKLFNVYFKLDENGYILESNIDGVFSAGRCNKNISEFVEDSIADGKKSANKIIKLLNK